MRIRGNIAVFSLLGLHAVQASEFQPKKIETQELSPLNDIVVSVPMGKSKSFKFSCPNGQLNAVTIQLFSKSIDADPLLLASSAPSAKGGPTISSTSFTRWKEDSGIVYVRIPSITPFGGIVTVVNTGMFADGVLEGTLAQSCREIHSVDPLFGTVDVSSVEPSSAWCPSSVLNLQCSGSGSCRSSGQCFCYPGYVGDACENSLSGFADSSGGSGSQTDQVFLDQTVFLKKGQMHYLMVPVPANYVYGVARVDVSASDAPVIVFADSASGASGGRWPSKTRFDLSNVEEYLSGKTTQQLYFPATKGASPSTNNSVRSLSSYPASSSCSDTQSDKCSKQCVSCMKCGSSSSSDGQPAPPTNFVDTCEQSCEQCDNCVGYFQQCASAAEKNCKSERSKSCSVECGSCMFCATDLADASCASCASSCERCLPWASSCGPLSARFAGSRQSPKGYAPHYVVVGVMHRGRSAVSGTNEVMQARVSVTVLSVDEKTYTQYTEKWKSSWSRWVADQFDPFTGLASLVDASSRKPAETQGKPWVSFTDLSSIKSDLPVDRTTKQTVNLFADHVSIMSIYGHVVGDYLGLSLQGVSQALVSFKRPKTVFDFDFDPVPNAEAPQGTFSFQTKSSSVYVMLISKNTKPSTPVTITWTPYAARSGGLSKYWTFFKIIGMSVAKFVLTAALVLAAVFALVLGIRAHRMGKSPYSALKGGDSSSQTVSLGSSWLTVPVWRQTAAKLVGWVGSQQARFTSDKTKPLRDGEYTELELSSEVHFEPSWEIPRDYDHEESIGVSLSQPGYTELSGGVDLLQVPNYRVHDHVEEVLMQSSGELFSRDNEANASENRFRLNIAPPPDFMVTRNRSLDTARSSEEREPKREMLLE